MFNKNCLYVDNIAELNKALLHASASKLINEIVLPPGEHTVTETIWLPEEVSLRGQNTTLLVDINDESQSAIEFKEGKSFYIKNCNIVGLNVEIISPCFSFIKSNRSLRTLISGCLITGNDLSRHNIVIGNEQQRGALKSNISNCAIFGAKESNVHYANVGNLHRIGDFTATSRSKRGITGLASTLTIDQCNIERNQEFSIDVEVRRALTLKGCYFENCNINVSGDQFFSASQTKFSGGEINLNNLQAARFVQCWFSSIRQISGAKAIMFEMCDIKERLRERLSEAYPNLILEHQN